MPEPLPRLPQQSSEVRSESASSLDRWNTGAWLFRDHTLRSLEILLDEAFRLPGTRFRFGIDGLIGLVPGLGDVIAGMLSLVIPLAAWVRGVPYITILRMVTNLAIGVLVGAIPVLGDLFDVLWKSNRRNYQLLQRHLRAPRRHTWRDWLFLASLALLLAAIFALPLVVLFWLIELLVHHLR